MSNKIGIGVQATFDGSAVNSGVDAMQQKVNQANKTQYNPVSPKAADNLKQVNAAFNQLMRIDGELRRRAKETGQLGAAFDDFNWEKAYPNPASRARKADSAAAYVLNPGNLGGGPTPGGAPGTGGGGFGGMAANAAQAGLRAAGPVGGVAAGAVGTGMSAGVGAGLMGLMGGMLALGVGKMVSTAVEKISQAEDNAVAYDKLKRVLGDVGVSFGTLKTVVQGSAHMLNLTFDETAKLTTQFAKAGNLTPEQVKSLPEEIKNGVGLSRSFGLDPSQGVGVMGQMRGLGVTKDVQDSRRFALLIGETIGKSGAFAKADEVMEAMASYATQQTRSSMGGANVTDYSGMLSGLVGSGIPGMDPTGAASLIGKINASLSGGGAKGEASQFFTNQVGAGMGLDPIQTQILREGGAFATNDNSFGEDSVYKRYMGKTGPDGGQTLLDGTMSQLRKQYGDNKGLLAQATANHLGVNMRQAMGLLSVQPNQMGEMESYAGDLTKMSGSGIGNLSKALYGSASDRQSLAKGYLGRKGADAIKAEDADAIKAAQGDDGKLRDVLGRIAGQYDQDRTQGSDIRDSKNALENIKVAMADKLVPLTQEIRHGVMYLAGGGKMSAMEIQKEVLKLESKDKVTQIGAQFDDKRKGAIGEADSILKQRNDALADLRANRSRMSPEQIQEAQKRITGLSDEYARKAEEVRLRILELQKEKAAAIEKENEELKKSIDGLARVNADRQAKADATDPETTGSIIRTPGDFARADRTGNFGGGRTSSNAGNLSPASKGETDEAMKFFMDKGWSREQASGIVSNFTAESKLKKGAIGDNGKAYGVAQWHPDRQADFKKWAGKDIRESTTQEQYAFAHYELTEGKEQDAGRRLRASKSAAQSGSVVSKYYERPKFTEAEAVKRADLAERINSGKAPDAPKGTLPGEAKQPMQSGSATPAPKAPESPKGTPIPLPPTGAGAGRGSGAAYDSLRITADPIIVRHENERGEQIMPTQTIKTKVSAPVSFGAGT